MVVALPLRGWARGLVWEDPAVQAAPHSTVVVILVLRNPFARSTIDADLAGLVEFHAVDVNIDASNPIVKEEPGVEEVAGYTDAEGLLGVHHRRSKWVITQLSTGLSVTFCQSRRNAFEVMKRLLMEVPKAAIRGSGSVFYKSIPNELHVWMNQMKYR